MKINKLNNEFDYTSNIEYTPLRNDAFIETPEEKIKKIELHVKEILNILGLDLNNNDLKLTPQRVAKMYVKETFSGLLPENIPKSVIFKNSYKYKDMLIEKNINVFSTCEHHLLPIIGKAHVAYISNETIIGLSTIHQIVDYYCKRPQVQERLTIQISYAIQKILKTKNVGCIINANHLCVISRGIRDVSSSTITTELNGLFKTNLDIQKTFLKSINIIS